MPPRNDGQRFLSDPYRVSSGRQQSNPSANKQMGRPEKYRPLSDDLSRLSDLTRASQRDEASRGLHSFKVRHLFLSDHVS